MDIPVRWKVKDLVKIGELAARSGVAPKTLRFYEDSGVIPVPVRKSNGYRDFGPESLSRLRFVRSAQSAGLTLREIREILTTHDRGAAPCEQVVEMLSEHLSQVRGKIRELATLETNLVALLSRAEGEIPSEADDVGVCWILESESQEGVAES